MKKREKKKKKGKKVSSPRRKKKKKKKKTHPYLITGRNNAYASTSDNVFLPAMCCNSSPPRTNSVTILILFLPSKICMVSIIFG